MDKLTALYEAMLRSRLYRLFISHAWDYGDEYDRFVKLLNSDLFFKWENVSVPKDDPLPLNPLFPKSYRYLVRQIDDRIKQCDCLLVLAGMYVNHRGWIQSEIEAAREYNKPIIAVEPFGNQRLPSMLTIQMIESVGWRRESVVAAIKKHVP
jgi:hypothetical protein